MTAKDDRSHAGEIQAERGRLCRVAVTAACFLLQTLPMVASSAWGTSRDYHRFGLYSDRSAAVNVAIDRYSPGYPASLDGDNLTVVNSNGDTACVFQSFADSGIVLRSTDTAPSYVDYTLDPPRTMTNIGVMACGRQVHADDAGRDAMRITVFYENGDSAAAVLAVGKQLRDVYFGHDYCGSLLPFYNSSPTDPLSVQLWADPEASGGNFLDAHEVVLPFARHALKATLVRVSSVPLGRPCMGGTLWSGIYLAGLTSWTELPHVLIVHGICGNASDWDPFAQVLADSGFIVDRLEYGSPTSSLRPAHFVGTLASKLATMGPDPVAVVAHSMGGLITRDYIRRQLASGRPNKIVQLVTLGTPHHGSDALAKILGWGPVVDEVIGPIFGKCLTNPASLPALLDMVPGASYLNRLNYGPLDLLYDDVLVDHGWSAHAAETELPGSVYLASIAGTGSFCDPLIRGLLWPRGSAYQPNDGTVATGGSLLSNTGTFRAADPVLALEKPAAHTNQATEPCGEAYYSFGTLAKRVATILRTAPAAPPLFAFSDEKSLAPAAVLATVEDSLQMAPAIADSVPAGQVLHRTVSVPTTSLARFTLFSTDAHLALVDPNGTTITVADTGSAIGVSFYATSDPGLEGFELVAPQPGTWTLRADASASTSGQQVAGVVEYASGSAVQLSVVTNPIYPGDVIRVRGQLASGGALRTDVSWTCSVLRPDGVSAALTLYDDGAHADSLSNDGIYGITMAPEGGAGQYALTATATAPGVGPLAAVAYGELADEQDLSVYWNNIEFSRNLAYAGDSLTIYATVHNYSSTPATGTLVEFRDLRTDAVLGTSTVDLGAESSVIVQAPWIPAAPDSHEIQVQISPYVLEESDYANNTASRIIVLGSPVSVDHGGAPTQLRFDPPYPNPTSRGLVFSFAVPRGNTGSLDVYDILGRRVRGWRWTNLVPGAHSVEWDGHSTSGQQLSPGVYLCRLQVGVERLQRKIILRH